ncbi:hypothetical protein [Sporosarcina psychrophila]|uniref:Oligosaccharide repeat unit polymerase n=1 Tax=Sporosarcina psychrophila TaxID=1476 RepID=A0ABV2K610_SPOPS
MQKVITKKLNKYLSAKDGIILLSIVVISVLVGIILLFESSQPLYYTWLPLLPVSFGLINILCFKIYRNIFDKLANIIIILLYTVRNVITPLIIMLGNYHGFFTLLNSENVNKAIALMIYETFVVFFFLAWRNNKIIVSIRKDNIPIKSDSKKRINFFGIIVCFIITFCLFAYITVPEIKASYVSIFEGDKLVTSLGTSDQYAAGSVNRVLYTLYNFFFGILQIFLPIFLIYKLRYKFGDKFSIGLVSCGIAFVNLFFMTNETAYTLIVILVLFIVILKLFPKNKFKLIMTSGLAFFLIIINIFLLKTDDMNVNMNSSSSSQDMFTMFQAYFPGVSNLAGVFNVINNSKITTLFYDLYSMIPFRATIFGIENDERLVLLYTYQNNAPANIIPFIGQAYHYLGFVIAPVVSVFLVNIALKYNEKLINQSNIWKYSAYLFLVIFLCSSLIMYNFTIFGARFFITILPMLILANFSSGSYRISNER